MPPRRRSPCSACRSACSTATCLIVERIFSWPGLGLYTVQSFASSDLPAVLGIAMVFGAFYILVTMLVEVLQSVADPRIAL